MSFLGSIGSFIANPVNAAVNAITGGGLGNAISGLTGNQQSTQTSTQTNTPWAAQQPYLMAGFGQAQNLLNQNIQLPALSQYTQQGMQSLANNPNAQLPGNYATAVLNGQYLDPSTNPYLQKTFNQAFGQVGNAVNSSFEGANRYGSGAQANALASEAGNLANQIYGGNYQQGIQNQMTMAGMAPSIFAAPANNMLTAGSIQDQYNQQAAMQPWQNLQNYMGAVTGNYGGTTTATNPIYKNTGAGVLGGALAGAQLGNLVPGIGTGIGAGAGALLGLLG